MKKALFGGAALVAALGMASVASAQENVLRIDGTSTVRSWTCETEDWKLETSPRTGFEEGVLRGEKSLETVKLAFPVRGIDCGNGTMNEHMQKTLEMRSHPEISYRMARYDIETVASGAKVKADGELTIAGQSRPVSMLVTVTRDATGGIRVQGEQQIRMPDFGVKPPSLMLGTLKVGEVVKVKFDVPLRVQDGALVMANPINN